MSFDDYEKISNKFIPINITPFPIKRSRNKTMVYLTRHFRSKRAQRLPLIAYAAVLMNSFYTQNRIVCAVTKRSLAEICEKAGLKFKEKDWTDFIRVVCKAWSFECIPGEFVGQPSIFIVKDSKVLKGIALLNPDTNMEELLAKQLKEVRAFVDKAKEIRKPQARLRY